MFDIIMAGYNYKEGKEFEMNKREGIDDYLFLFFRKPVYITLENETILTEENTCILYGPNYPRIYHNKEAGFINDFFHFNYSKQKNFLEKLEIDLNKPFMLDDHSFISLAIESLEQEYILSDSYYEENINAMLTTFFIKVSRNLSKNKNHGEKNYLPELNKKFRSARIEILSNYNKDWSISNMASLVNLSDSRFSILYKKYFNVSPKKDLQNERLKMAKYLLKSTSLPVSQISRQVGYNSLFHFSKQFKKKIGSYPTDYR